MSGPYLYTPAIWAPLLAAVFLVAIGSYALRRREVPGALPFAVAWLLGAVWMFSVAGEAAAVDPAAKSAWLVFGLVWQLPIATAMAFFALEYTQPGRWLTRRNLVLAAMPCLLAMLLVASNDLHHLVWYTPATLGSIKLPFGIGTSIALAYVLLLAVVQVVPLAWLFLHSPQHRWPVALMLLLLVITHGSLLLSAVLADLSYWMDYSVTLCFLATAVYTVALFGFHLFDPQPSAQRAVIEQMRAGVVIFDVRQRVASLNPTAERMLGLCRGEAQGKTWQELPVPREFLSLLLSPDAAQSGTGVEGPEVTLGSGLQARYFVPAFSALTDFRGLTVGYLLILRDVSEQRRVQAQVVEQQRGLATLHERERLARELHDSIGQVLGYACFQVEAANQLIATGREQMAMTQLARLASTLQDAHADLREYILDLRSAPSPEQSFFVLVQHYLDGFRSNYNLETRLSLDPAVGEDRFPPEMQLQILRILQEALSNARKHSQARSVQVTFAAVDGHVRVSIEDDGCGFEVDEAVPAGEIHLGLHFMRERAEELGGTLQVRSERGAGTCVALTVPLTEKSSCVCC